MGARGRSRAAWIHLLAGPAARSRLHFPSARGRAPYGELRCRESRREPSPPNNNLGNRPGFVTGTGNTQSRGGAYEGEPISTEGRATPPSSRIQRPWAGPGFKGSSSGFFPTRACARESPATPPVRVRCPRFVGLPA